MNARQFKVVHVQMKFLLPIFGLMLAVLSAPAQVVSVEIKLDQDQFLPGESLPVTVRVYNNSGQTLHLGTDENWLTFNVTALDNNNAGVIRYSNPPVVGAFDLGSSQVATKRVDIAPYFALKHAGRYNLVATIHVKSWGTDYSSTPKEFDVIDGAELWSRDFGVPAPPGVTNRPPEIRKYILEEANYLRQQLRMYVLVSDQSRSQIYKVSAIGPMVSFSQPEAQLDDKSNLHVLYQSGARSFIYSVINPDGDIVHQDIYDIYNTRPRLSVGKNGNISVAGGVRRVKPGELPVIETPDEVAAPGKQ